MMARSFNYISRPVESRGFAAYGCCRRHGGGLRAGEGGQLTLDASRVSKEALTQCDAGCILLHSVVPRKRVSCEPGFALGIGMVLGINKVRMGQQHGFLRRDAGAVCGWRLDPRASGK